jgi:hypothetical protein
MSGVWHVPADVGSGEVEIRPTWFEHKCTVCSKTVMRLSATGDFQCESHQAYLAIICRRHNSDLITIWSRPATIEQGAIDLQWCRDNKGDDFVFGLVTL